MSNVVLISPRISDLDVKTYSPEVSENLGLAYLAAYLQSRDVSVRIYDLNSSGITLDELLEKVASDAPRLVGISANSAAYLADAAIFARLLRCGGVQSHITVGGHHVSNAPCLALAQAPEIDSVVVGEGEETLWQLYSAIAHGRAIDRVDGIAFRDGKEVVKAARRLPVGDVDVLPLPSRYNAARAAKLNQAVHVVSSRGCYGSCSFCQAAHGQGWRPRSPESIVREMELLRASLGARHFVFDDENFLGHVGAAYERASALCKLIAERLPGVTFKISCRADDVTPELLDSLMGAGLTKINVGIESFTQRQLDLYNKRVTVAQNLEVIRMVKQRNLKATFSFIMFDPFVTLVELRTNASTIREHLGYFNFRKTRTSLRPLPGTAIFKQLKQQGLLKEMPFGDYAFVFAHEGSAAAFDTVCVARCAFLQLEKEYERLRKERLLLALMKPRSTDLSTCTRHQMNTVEKSMTELWLDILGYAIDCATSGTFPSLGDIRAAVHVRESRVYQAIHDARTSPTGAL